MWTWLDGRGEKMLVCWAMLFLNLSFCIHWRIITKGAGLTLLPHGESPCFFAMCPIYLACVATKTRGRDQRVWVRALLIGVEGTAPARITRLVQKGKITSLTFLKMFCAAVNNKWNLACCCCNLQPKTIKGEMVFNLIKKRTISVIFTILFSCCCPGPSSTEMISPGSTHGTVTIM